MGYTIFRHTQMRFGRGCLWKLFRLGFLEVPQTLRHLLGSNFPWQRSKTGGWGTTYEKVGMCPQISRAALNDGFLLASSCYLGEDGSKSSTPYFLKEMQELMLKMTDFPRPLIPATVAATTLVPGAKAKAEAADFSVSSHSHRGAEQRKAHFLISCRRSKMIISDFIDFSQIETIQTDNIYIIIIYIYILYILYYI